LAGGLSRDFRPALSPGYNPTARSSEIGMIPERLEVVGNRNPDMPDRKRARGNPSARPVDQVRAHPDFHVAGQFHR
jgi:hypothetical protein